MNYPSFSMDEEFSTCGHELFSGESPERESSLHGINDAATSSGMQILEMGCWATVRMRDMKPKLLSSSIQMEEMGSNSAVFRHEDGKRSLEG